MPSAMVVDDQTGARRSAATILRNSGIKVRTARDGSEAIRKQRRNPADVVVLDMKMALDGLTTAKEIRDFDNRAGFVALTAYENDYCARAGADLISCWISKPLLKAASRQSLVAAVERASVLAGFPSREFVLRLLSLGGDKEFQQWRERLGKGEVLDEALDGISVDDIRTFVGERVQSLFATYGHRALLFGGEHLRVTEDEKFSPQFARALMDRLPIDVYNAKLILDELFNELRHLVVYQGLIGSWGRLAVVEGDLWLEPSPVDGSN